MTKNLRLERFWSIRELYEVNLTTGDRRELRLKRKELVSIDIATGHKCKVEVTVIAESSGRERAKHVDRASIGTVFEEEGQFVQSNLFHRLKIA